MGQALLIPEGEKAAAERSLTDKKGRSLEVELLSATDAKVEFRVIATDKIHEVLLGTLSDEDQKAIELWREQNAEKDDVESAE